SGCISRRAGFTPIPSPNGGNEWFEQRANNIVPTQSLGFIRTLMENTMSCMFCETFGHYERQIARRLGSDSFALSEENAQRLVSMAAQIRNLARTTLRHVDNEAAPTMLCDLVERLAAGRMAELRHKRACAV